MLKTQVLVVDDHPTIRLAVRMVLERDGFQVSDAADGAQAVQLSRRDQPDLVILDIGLPKLDGLDAIQRIRVISPASKILVFTGQPAEIFAQRSLQAGASGFIHKQEDLSDLVRASRALLSGHSYFPAFAFSPDGQTHSVGPEVALLDRLSDREITVLKLLAEGRRNQQIAEALLLSSKTVSTYKTRLMQKLNATSLVELTDFARRHGLSK